MRALWTEERVNFDGDYYRTARATDLRPARRAGPDLRRRLGPLAAKLAGRVGDGFICTSGKKPGALRRSCSERRGGRRGRPAETGAIVRMIEIKVSYDHDRAVRADACRWWAALALTPEEKEGVEDPIEMERLADAAADRAHTRFIVSDDPEEVVEKIGCTSSSASRTSSSTRPARTSAASSSSSARTSCPSSAASETDPYASAARSRSAIARPSSARERIASLR